MACYTYMRVVFQTAPLLYSEEISIPPAKVQHHVLCKNRQCLSI
jgi:hypothetical protein